MKTEFKTIIYIETKITSPFQMKWKKVKRKLSFIPYPGLLLREGEILVSVINSVYNLDKNTVEVYTREQNIAATLPPTVVN